MNRSGWLLCMIVLLLALPALAWRPRYSKPQIRPCYVWAEEDGEMPDANCLQDIADSGWHDTMIVVESTLGDANGLYDSDSTPYGPYTFVDSEEVLRFKTDCHAAGLKMTIYMSPYYWLKKDVEPAQTIEGFLTRAGELQAYTDGFYLDYPADTDNDEADTITVLQGLRTLIGRKNPLILHASNFHLPQGSRRMPTAENLCDLIVDGELIDYLPGEYHSGRRWYMLYGTLDNSFSNETLAAHAVATNGEISVWCTKGEISGLWARRPYSLRLLWESLQ